MVAFGIILCMGLTGYAGAPWWLVLPGAAGLTLSDWWMKLRLLYWEPSAAWSTKTTTYFVTGIVRDIGFTALAFGAGRVVRAFWG